MKTIEHLQRGIASCGCRMLTAVLLALCLAACSKDDDITDPTGPDEDTKPASTFNLHVNEGNIISLNGSVPDYYPTAYGMVTVMEQLPADEKLLYVGGVYSIANEEPDMSDSYSFIDVSDWDLFQTWDWSSPLYWTSLWLTNPLPGTTYHLRGMAVTERGTYYTNPIDITTDPVPADTAAADAYEIPVVFHLFPDSTGSYNVPDWIIQEQFDYANVVYANRHNIPGQTETGVRFTLATHTPDGTPLETPGIVREKEPESVIFHHAQIDEKYVWDMEQVLNVWVMPVINEEGLAGFSWMPRFDEDELLEGCNVLRDPEVFTGIFLNASNLAGANQEYIFAHEAGHFLGLDHVFEPAGDYCDDTPWYDRDAYLENINDYIFWRADETGQEFVSDNVMDYYYGFCTGFTPSQVERIQYTLKHAYFIPGPAGKTLPASSPAAASRSDGSPRRFGGDPVW